MQLLRCFSVWIDGRKTYVISSWSHSFLLWLVCCCCFSESKEHYRRYNAGTRHSGNHHSVPAENLVPQEPPAFESATPVNVTVEKGQAAFLHCKIKNQGDYTVSWVRYVRGDFNIVAIGTDVFIPDNRFSLIRIPGSADWTLRIVSVRQFDEGIYECQIGTTPKMGRNITLQVIEAQPLQADSEDFRPRPRTTGEEVARAIIKGIREAHVGQDLNLTCYVASSFPTPTNNLIRWYHNESHLKYDSSVISGHQIEIFQSPNGMFSRLFIRATQPFHAGKYTCSQNAAESSTIFVQILPSKHPIAMSRTNSAEHFVPSCLLATLCSIVTVFLTVINSRRK